MNIIMMGPQGSGKGTQSALLSSYLGVPSIAAGVLFRAEIKRETGLGKAIKEYVDKGDIVPPDIVNTVMRERLQEDDAEKGMIVDGYPRTEQQAAELDDILREVDKAVTFAVYLAVPDAIAIERMKERHRSDDTPEVISHRLDQYHSDTEPLIKYYKERGVLVEIDGTEEIEVVQNHIRAALGV